MSINKLMMHHSIHFMLILRKYITRYHWMMVSNHIYYKLSNNIIHKCMTRQGRCVAGAEHHGSLDANDVHCPELSW